MRQEDTSTLADRRHKIQKPRMYNVVMLNDNITTFSFVVAVLDDIFNKSAEDAVDTASTIHFTGKDICGTYTQDIAETKVDETHARAKKFGFPLRAIAEPVPPS